HFPAGEAGPLTILVRNDEPDPDTGEGFFDTNEGTAALNELIGKLEDRRSELGIADIRYFDAPLGLKTRPNPDATPHEKARHRQSVRRAKSYYVSAAPEMKGTVTRVDVVFRADPFARESIDQLTDVESAINTARKIESLGSLKNASFHYVGPTASI